MRLISFNFNKILVEKTKPSVDNFKFNTKIDISSIDSLKSEAFKFKEDLLKVDFVYTILYEPDFAKVELAGTIILSVESKLAKEVVKGWKDKQTNNDFKRIVFNIILKKANIKAIQLEDELGLPIHLPLPTISPTSSKPEQKEKDSQ